MSKGMDLYKKIYNLADENMKKNGKRLSCSYLTFASRIGVAPDVVDISEFDGLTNEEIFFAAYLRCLDRMPEEGAWSLYNRLTEVCKHTESSFQLELLSVISESEEFKGNYKKITGLYDTQSEEKKYQLQESMKDREKQKKKYYLQKEYLLQKIDQIKNLCFGKVILPVWKIFPVSVKNMVRKAAGREMKR